MNSKELRNNLKALVTSMQNQISTSLIEAQKNGLLINQKTENMSQLSEHIKSQIGIVGLNAMETILKHSRTETPKPAPQKSRKRKRSTKT